MSTQGMSPHVTRQDLVAYFVGELQEDQESPIEEHLAVCDDCTSHARQLYAAQEKQLHSFARVWNRWTAEEHGRAHQVAVLDAALQAAASHNPQWGERFHQWRERWAGKAEAAVRVVMEAQETASRIITEGLETLTRPGGMWQFALQPTPVPVVGTVRTRGQTAPSPVAVALAPGDLQARVAVSGEKEISVRVDEWPPGQTPPLVLLISTTEKSEPQVKELERTRGATYLITRFENVEPGDYVVAFEPLEPANT